MKTNVNTTGHIIVFNINDKVTASTKDAKIMFPHRNIEKKTFAPISIYRVSEIVDKGTYAFFDGQQVEGVIPSWKELEQCLGTLIDVYIEDNCFFRMFRELGMCIILTKEENIVITKDSLTKEVLMFVEPKYLTMDDDSIKCNPRYYSIFNSTKGLDDIPLSLSIAIINILRDINYKVDEKQMAYILEKYLTAYGMSFNNIFKAGKHFSPMGCTLLLDDGHYKILYTAYYCDDSEIPTVLKLSTTDEISTENNVNEWQAVANFMMDNRIGPVNEESSAKIGALLLPDYDHADPIIRAYIKKNNVGELCIYGCKCKMLTMSVNGFYSRDLLDKDFLDTMDREIEKSYSLEDEHIAYLKKCIRLGYKDPISEIKLHYYKQYYNLSE